MSSGMGREIQDLKTMIVGSFLACIRLERAGNPVCVSSFLFCGHTGTQIHMNTHILGGTAIYAHTGPRQALGLGDMHRDTHRPETMEKCQHVSPRWGADGCLLGPQAPATPDSPLLLE